MDVRNCQTTAASPAEPEGLPLLGLREKLLPFGYCGCRRMLLCAKNCSNKQQSTCDFEKGEVIHGR
jgi:hypothetical protein